MFKVLGELIGGTVGLVLGMSAAAIAEVLELPVAMVKEAREAGCKTYEEIREFCKEI